MSTIRRVFIVGNDGAFLIELVNKFYKEGWHIDLLSEQTIHSRLPGEVETYRFAFQSASVKELMESCAPELVLFTGAYDARCSWRDETHRADTSDYIAGLNNILTCASAAGVKQFAYLSSAAVFEASSTADIPEDTEPTPKSPYGLCVAQGETVASSFGKFSGMEVTIVRIGDLYAIPRSQDECIDRYTEMCLNALLKGTVTVNAKRISAPLFVKDAVYALFLILTAGMRNHRVYHLAAHEEANEEDIARVIKNTSHKPITVLDQTSGVTDRRVLSGKRAADEFHFSARMDYEHAVAMIVTYMEEHRKNYGLPKKNGLLDKLRSVRTAVPEKTGRTPDPAQGSKAPRTARRSY